MTLIPTPWQTVGPYLHIGLTDTRSVARIASEATQGERVRLTCRVFDADGLAVPDALIEIWQASSAGKYSHPSDPSADPVDLQFRGFGRMPTDPSGCCVFETIKPGRVPGLGGRLQAPHLNVSVLGRGLLKRLPTRIYFAGEPSNPEDEILALVPESRRPTLLAHKEEDGGWMFPVRLAGENETVFFDI